VLFEFDNKSIDRSHSWELKKRRYKTDLRQHIVSERVVNLWNRLDICAVSATSVNRFKNRLQEMRSHGELTFRPINSCGRASPPRLAVSGKLSGKIINKKVQAAAWSGSIRAVHHSCRPADGWMDTRNNMLFCCLYKNSVSSVMRYDDSWPATVPLSC